MKASLETLAVLVSRIPPASAPLRAAQRRAATALLQLQALSAKWPADSPEDYRDNLSGDVKALEGALTTGNVDALVATIQIRLPRISRSSSNTAIGAAESSEGRSSSGCAR